MFETVKELQKKINKNTINMKYLHQLQPIKIGNKINKIGYQTSYTLMVIISNYNLYKIYCCMII